MAITFKQSTTGSGTASPLSTTNFAGTVVAGNLMVVTVVDDSGISEPSMTVTDTGGNTYTRRADTLAANTGTTTAWSAPIVTGGATFHIIVTNPGGAFARMTVVAQEFQGFTGTPTFDKVSAYATGSSTAALSATSGTLTNAAELVVGHFGHYATASAFTLGTGYTNLGTVSVANASIAQESKVVAATTAVTAGATIAASREWNAYVTTYFDAPSFPRPSVSDTTTVTDSVVIRLISYINVSDTTVVTEDLSYYPDTVIMSDSVAINIVAAPTGPQVLTSDTTVMSDSVQLQLFSNINVSDTTPVTDTKTIELFSYPSVSDTTAVSDTVAIKINTQVPVSDTTVVTDSVNLQIISYINVSDTTPVTDSSVIFIPTLTLSVSDTTTVTDSTSESLTSYINVSDTTPITESISLGGVLALTVSDTTVITDTTAENVSVRITTSDTTVVTDSVSVVVPILSLSVSDTTTVSDSVQISSKEGIITSDTTTVTDTVSIFIPTLVINVSDTTVVTDVPGIESILLIAIVGTPMFSPTSISGLQIWLDASQITGLTTGSTVTTWLDASGNSSNATPGAYSPPTYQTNVLNGRPVVQFVASGNQALRAFYTQIGGGNAAFTTFVVGRLDGTTNARLFGSVYPDNSNWLSGWWNALEDVAYFNGGFAGPEIPADTNWKQYTAKGDGASTGYLYSSGVLLSPNSTLFGNPNGAIALSGYDSSGAGNELSDGQIAEVLVYNSALSDSDRGLVETYLHNKYFGSFPPSGEVVTVTDSVFLALVSSSAVSVSDTTVVTDTVSILIPTLYIAVSDTTVVTDQPVLSPTSYINVQDTTPVTDQPILRTVSTIAVSDTTPVTDSVNLELISYITVSDTTPVTDTDVLKVNVSLNVSDTTVVTDSPNVHLLSYINVQDTTVVTDTTSDFITTLFINVSDTTPISELIAVNANSGVFVFDSTTVTDTVSLFFPVQVFTVSDTTIVTDQPIIHIVSFPTVSDTTIVTDQPIINLRSYVSVQDTTPVSDTVSLSLTNNVVVSDTTPITDTVSINVRVPVATSDTTVISDSVVIELIDQGIRVSDTTPVTDSVVIRLPYLVISVSDTTNVTDHPVMSGTLYINVSDTTKIHERTIINEVVEKVIGHFTVRLGFKQASYHLPIDLKRTIPLGFRQKSYILTIDNAETLANYQRLRSNVLTY